MLGEKVEQDLKPKYSPEQISGRLLVELLDAWVGGPRDEGGRARHVPMSGNLVASLPKLSTSMTHERW